ncbi:hypothetical protein ANCDUO_21982, partial [Ancylostoma duodenale]
MEIPCRGCQQGWTDVKLVLSCELYGQSATMVVMGSQKDKKKKFKGKKKVKNLLEKKAKGLKLNQVDRKRLGK